MAFELDLPPFLKVWDSRHYLGLESQSAVQFSIHPDSIHTVSMKGKRPFQEIVYDIPIIGRSVPFQEIVYDIPIIGRSVQIDQLQLDNNNKTSYSLICNKLLSQLFISDDDRNWLTLEIISKANALMDNIRPGIGNILWLMALEIRNFTICRVDGDLANYFDIAMRDWDQQPSNNNGMVPATWTSISSLKQEVFHNRGFSCQGTCAICLGDLPRVSYVTRMPCQHVFHVKCIVKWLNESHYCPICRFEMPS